VIRIAAVGDVHYDRHPRPEMSEHFRSLNERADLFLIAGDLTQSGALEEAQALVVDLAPVKIPVVIVLGNHDFHQNREREMLALFRERGMIALEGESAVFNIRGHSVGISGLKGFGGGFFGACATEFGEPEMKAFARVAKIQAEILRSELEKMRSHYKFALLHFSPIEGTLLGERREIYPFLGNYLLAEAMDQVGIDGAFHGHAHHGVEKGQTRSGIPVRNVALPVIRHSYNIYHFAEKVSEKSGEKVGERETHRVISRICP
jgi:Icc-related predicted phosphoesterase